MDSGRKENVVGFCEDQDQHLGNEMTVISWAGFLVVGLRRTLVAKLENGGKENGHEIQKNTRQYST